MNRNNIWIHVTLAVILITIAAVLGQIDRWQSTLRSAPALPQQNEQQLDAADDSEGTSIPEVLVRFKPGISLDRDSRRC